MRQSLRRTDEEQQLVVSVNHESAARIREMRCLMGLSQKEVYVPMKMNPGQYSRIESGELSTGEVLKFLQRRFEQWKEKEINRLENRIKYINSL